MSMVINLVEDHNIYLCEGGPVYNGGVQPTPPPITYLTQWKIVGNSEVHTDEYLTSWKVSGNSVVDNNTILSCGDLGLDGKYHVKISNGVDIYDIALNEPLRKVNDVADTIEFPSSVEGKALVTRKFYQETITKYSWLFSSSTERMYCRIPNIKGAPANNIAANILFPTYPTLTHDQTVAHNYGVSVQTDNAVCFYDENYQSSDMINAFKEHISGLELLYELATPTTELVDVSPFPTSPTDTYTSANVTPYSAFEHTENKEIWSCGEYNATDGKYHILVKPQGGSIADIALTEPLRKVRTAADTIEFPSETDGKAFVTRRFSSILIGNATLENVGTDLTDIERIQFNNITAKPVKNSTLANILCSSFKTKPERMTYACSRGISVNSRGNIRIYDPDYNTDSDINDFQTTYADTEVIYELATPTTELVDAPQIEEADSYSMIISQGGKAVSWSEFLYTINYLLTDSENNLIVDSENYQLTVQN